MEIYAKSRPERYLREEGYIPRAEPNRGVTLLLHGVYCSRSKDEKKG